MFFKLLETLVLILMAMYLVGFPVLVYKDISAKEIKGDIPYSYIANRNSITSTNTAFNLAYWDGKKWDFSDLGVLPNKFMIKDFRGKWVEIIECEYDRGNSALYNCIRGDKPYAFLRGSIVTPLWNL